MRVLYAVPHPLPYSENYITDEISWMESHGVEVSLWARHPRLSRGSGAYDGKTLVGPPITDAIRRFRPDIVHAHPLFTAADQMSTVVETGVPMTARAHVGFSGLETGDPVLMRELVGRMGLEKVWAFPHIATEVDHPRVSPLPSILVPNLFYPGSPDEARKLVVRAGVALPGKGLEEFVEVARLCPDVPFVLALAVPDHAMLKRLVDGAPPNVEFHVDVEREQVATLFKSAWLCFRGHDPAAHRYGMPMSVVEAMGCGLPVVARRSAGSEAYIGDAGIYYSTAEEAATVIAEARAWSPPTWEAARARSVARAGRHRIDDLLPAVLDFWRGLIS